MNLQSRYIEILGQNKKDEKFTLDQITDLNEDYNMEIDYSNFERYCSQDMKIEIRVFGYFHSLSITEIFNKSDQLFLNLQDSYSLPAKIDNLTFNNVDKVKVLGGITKVMFIGNATSIKNINITLSNIETLITHKIDELKLNSCFINEMILNVNGSSQDVSNLYSKNIWVDGCEIKKIMVINTINEIEIIKSRINELIILDAKIRTYRNKETKIEEIRGICIDTFETQSEDSCNLGIEYSKINEDYKLYEFYNTQKMELALSKSNFKNRIPLWFLKHSIGYGFKPLKAFSFSLLNIFIFSIIYLVADLIRGNIILFFPKNMSDIAKSLELVLLYAYQSGITYTTIGFEDMIFVNPLIGLIYVLEAMLGVSVLSLMVVSLTRKYFFGK